MPFGKHLVIWMAHCLLLATCIPAASALDQTVARASGKQCKPIPGDVGWPMQNDFDILNRTIGGRLILTRPPAAVCYPAEELYNATECSSILSSWFDANFHAQDPASIDFPQFAGNPCPPLFPNGTSVTGDKHALERGCTIGAYPTYVVNASETEHVKAAVRFAKDFGIRLNVKGTGHSFQGRSTSLGSLSVWLHHMRGVEFLENFESQSCPETGRFMAARICAGERIRNILTTLNEHGVVISSGSAQTVGIMGWFTGGGHGPISSTYGLGVDNVLQLTAVTAAGDVVVANACENADLFWALRGGGGGTFGVVTEVVMKAYPTPHTTFSSFKLFISPEEQDLYWKTVAFIHSELPRLKQGGLQGFYVNFPFDYALQRPDDLTFSWCMQLLDKPIGTIDALFAPLKLYLDALQARGRLQYSFDTTEYNSFFEAWNDQVDFEGVAQGGAARGSRLLSADALNDTARLSQVLREITLPVSGDMSTQAFLVGHVVAPGTDPNGTSVHPAWRKTVSHLVVVENFPDYISVNDQEKVYDRVTFNRTGPLRDLDPHAGVYFNEADPFEPDWQTQFWGPNYDRLVGLKRYYDPDSMLWCVSCVGSESWNITPEGRLCKL